MLKEEPKSPKTTKASRAEQALQASKRRSTMNSRDAAYDDEQLLRAIEASREAAPEDLYEPGIRRTKRSRSDSEEYVRQFPKLANILNYQQESNDR